jgi:glutamyl-tRNA reductase
MNRTPDHAKNIAEKFGGDVVSFCELKEVLTRVDLCICSASAPHYLLEKDVVERVMPLRAHKPLLFIDISMPRNIDPQIKGIDQVFLYQIDDLQEVVISNMKVRENAIKSVKAIIDDKIAGFEQKLLKLPGPADELPSRMTSLSDPVA